MKAHAPAPSVQADPGLFLADLDVATIPDLFAALVGVLAERRLAQDRDALLRVLLEREAIGTTAIGRGLALPHVRSHVVQATAVAFARLRRPLAFGAADGQPVQSAVLLVAPYGAAGTLYQPLLAVLAEAAHDEARRLRTIEVATFTDFDRWMRESIHPRLQEVLSR